MKLERLKYSITLADLKKRSFGAFIEPSSNSILQLIAEDEQSDNSFVSHKNISLLERNVLKNIRYSIYGFGFLGLLGIGFGLYKFLFVAPSIAINLKTSFPLIENGTYAIILSLVAILGSIYSYIKRESILISMVKSKIIKHFREIQREKIHTTPTHITSRRKKKVRHKPKKRRRK